MNALSSLVAKNKHTYIHEYKHSCKNYTAACGKRENNTKIMDEKSSWSTGVIHLSFRVLFPVLFSES